MTEVLQPFFEFENVIKEIESAAQPSGAPHTEWDVPVFFGAHETVLADIGRDLGVGAKKNREK